MTLYDFMRTDGASGKMVVSPRIEAPDLHIASEQALKWSKDARHIRGERDDATKWPMLTVESREPYA